VSDEHASRNGRASAEDLRLLEDEPEFDAIVDSSGWFSVQLRYAYLVGSSSAPMMVEDRVVLVDGDDEEAALGRAIEIAEEYEDDFETEDGEEGQIRFEGIVAIKELDDPPAAGTEVWHEFMAPSGVETDVAGEPLPALRPVEMAFPRAHDE
jgi:hypothetical protein